MIRQNPQFSIKNNGLIDYRGKKVHYFTLNGRGGGKKRVILLLNPSAIWYNR